MSHGTCCEQYYNINIKWQLLNTFSVLHTEQVFMAAVCFCLEVGLEASEDWRHFGFKRTLQSLRWKTTGAANIRKLRGFINSLKQHVDSEFANVCRSALISCTRRTWNSEAMNELYKVLRNYLQTVCSGVAQSQWIIWACWKSTWHFLSLFNIRGHSRCAESWSLRTCSSMWEILKAQNQAAQPGTRSVDL